jgi:hypothetical protein
MNLSFLELPLPTYTICWTYSRKANASLFAYLGRHPGLQQITVLFGQIAEGFAQELVGFVKEVNTVRRFVIKMKHSYYDSSTGFMTSPAKEFFALNEEESIRLAEAFGSNKCISILEAPCAVSFSVARKWLDVVENHNFVLEEVELCSLEMMARAFLEDVSRVLDQVDYYCALNKAGRAKLRWDTILLEVYVDVLSKAPENLVYGLLRDDPNKCVQLFLAAFESKMDES